MTFGFFFLHMVQFTFCANYVYADFPKSSSKQEEEIIWSKSWMKYFLRLKVADTQKGSLSHSPKVTGSLYSPVAQPSEFQSSPVWRNTTNLDPRGN